MVLVSSATYGACGSSDQLKGEPEGGAAGASEGGEPSSTSAGGTKSGGTGAVAAGAPNGLAGEGGAGVELGGAPQGGVGASAGAAGADNLGGAGGEPDLPTDTLPSACPGTLSQYTTLLGTNGDDVFTSSDVSGQKLIFGLDGADSFPTEHGGQDCLVGGRGNDDFTNSDEFVNYYYGGSGDDTYHVNTAGNYLRIADFELGDRIALDQAAFPLTGAPGDTPSPIQVLSVPGFSMGTSTNSEASVIVYDPNSGELWRDVGGGTKDDGSAAVILTILNKDTYVFDVDDFFIEATVAPRRR
jgi:hypothetical protein